MTIAKRETSARSHKMNYQVQGADKSYSYVEKPKGETVNYDDLIKAWREGKVR